MIKCYQQLIDSSTLFKDVKTWSDVLNFISKNDAFSTIESLTKEKDNWQIQNSVRQKLLAKGSLTKRDFNGEERAVPTFPVFLLLVASTTAGGVLFG